MDGDTRSRPRLEPKYELLYRLMLIAAVAVIIVSLVGIASMTGFLPRVGAAETKTDAVKPRPDARQPDREKSDKQMSPRVMPQPAYDVALSSLCSDTTYVSAAHHDLRIELITIGHDVSAG